MLCHGDAPLSGSESKLSSADLTIPERRLHNLTHRTDLEQSSSPRRASRFSEASMKSSKVFNPRFLALVFGSVFLNAAGMRAAEGAIRPDSGLQGISGPVYITK